MKANTRKQPKTLLHACCGPCSLEPTRILRERGQEVTLFYANSNIDPGEEYARRLATLQSWAKDADLAVAEGPYDHDAWRAAVRQAALEHPGDRSERCRACYRLRLEQAARYAAAQGFDALGTTLSVSPYQYTDIIAQEVERAAALAGIRASFDDFRPFYEEATRRSRALGMYRQNYCGCEISFQEAQQEREERKRERAAQREEYLREHAAEIAAQEMAREQNRREKQEYAAKRARQRAILKQMRAADPQ